MYLFCCIVFLIALPILLSNSFFRFLYIVTFFNSIQSQFTKPTFILGEELLHLLDLGKSLLVFGGVDPPLDGVF